METEPRSEQLGGMPDPTAQRLRQLLAYAPETAGGMMLPHAISLSLDLDVQGAINVTTSR
jgi:Mg/Co/Ni transporter MgtE